jgi:uncharacterized protein YggU (UPF0235/DUF167 family)
MDIKLDGKLSDPRGGAAFTVRVITRAARTELAGVDEESGAVRVRLMASPAGDPAANKELLDFIAVQLNVPLNKLEIVAGANDREKIISVEGVSTTEVEAKFGQIE